MLLESVQTRSPSSEGSSATSRSPIADTYIQLRTDSLCSLHRKTLSNKTGRAGVAVREPLVTEPDGKDVVVRSPRLTAQSNSCAVVRSLQLKTQSYSGKPLIAHGLQPIQI